MKQTLKRILSIAIGLVLAASAHGRMRSQTMTVSTDGPDRYADGTPVLVGESYLLVYVAAGRTFAGVRTDGTLVDAVGNKIAATFKAVDGSRCGFHALDIPTSVYPANGSWALVLLDTRDANGQLGGLTVGRSDVVVGVNQVRVQGVGGVAGLNVKNPSGAGGLISDILPPGPADMPVPVIAGIAPGAAGVDIRIRNFVDGANYEVQSCTDIAAGNWQPAAGGGNMQRRTHLSGDELLATVTVPESDTVRFFRVIVPGGK